MTVPSPSASRPRQSPPARWSRGGAGPPPRGRSPLAPLLPRTGEMPECPPWALRPFVRSCICAPARPCTRVPVPPSPSPERVKCPGSSAGRLGSFARSRGRLAVGRSSAAGGVGLTPPGGGSPRRGRDGPPDGRLRCSRLASRRGRAGETPGCVRRATAAFRPLGWARQCEGATGAPPTASGRNTAVRPRGGRGISPARGHDARPGGNGAAGGVEATAWRRGASRRGRGGPPGGRLHRMRLASPTSGRNTRVRPQGDRGISPARGSDARNGRPSPGGRGQGGRGPSGRGPGGRSGTYGRHAGRE